MKRSVALKTRVNFAEPVLDRLQMVGVLGALMLFSICAAFAYKEHSSLAQLMSQVSQPTKVAESIKQRKATPTEEQAQRTSEVIADRLNLPFFDMMKSLEPPQDIDVVLLALDLRVRLGQSRQGSLIRLTAEAHTARDMTNYLAWLNTRKTLRSATLIRHQLQSQQSGQPLRFELEVVAR